MTFSGLVPDDRSDDEYRKLALLHRRTANQSIKVKTEWLILIISAWRVKLKTTQTRLHLCDLAKASDSSNSGERLCK